MTREEQLGRDLRQAERVIAEQEARIRRLESELAEARGRGKVKDGTTQRR